MKQALIILLIISCFSCTKPGTTIIIPQGYKGEVTIFYNQENGVPEKYEAGKRLLIVPNSGVLLTKFKEEEGKVTRNYYYTDHSGRRLPLHIYTPEDIRNDGLIAKNELGVFYDGTKGRYGAVIENLPYEWCIVSDFRGLDSISLKTTGEAYKQKLKNAIGYDFLNTPIPDGK